MKFVMLRDRVVASVTGHAVEFKKGEPTHVPAAMYKEVLAAGGVPEDELPDDDAKKTVEPTDAEERAGLLAEAIKIIVERARREDFGATGAPNVKVLSTELGWTVNAQERDIAWAQFQAAD